MRNISFHLTRPQILARTKTVTRRVGWEWLEPGTLLAAVEKCQGLKKGGRVVRLATIRVLSVRRERLDAITPADCAAEGFPELSPAQFVAMFCQHMGCVRATKITRIEFEYEGELTGKSTTGR